MIYGKRYNQDLDIGLSSVKNLSFLENKKIFITGATGLIGSAIVDMLLHANTKENLNVSIFAGGRSFQKFSERFGEAKVQFVDYDATQPLSFDQDFDYVIHAASNAHPRAYSTEPVETMLANFLGMNNILEYSVKHDVSRILYISSSEVYGKKDNSELYFEEDYGYVDILNPRSCYPSSKRATETLCASYVEEYDLDVVITRPGHIYGPTFSDNDSRAFAQFAKQTLANEPIEMTSPGLQLRSYTYVMDAASAILYILINGDKGEVYNVSNKESIVTIRELANTFSKLNNTQIKSAKADVIEAKGYNMMENSALDSKKLENLGWVGKFNIDQGVSSTIEILKEKSEKSILHELT